MRCHGHRRAGRSPHEITKRERYREIIAVLARHGFRIVDDRMLKHEKAEQARAEHLRLACEELGTLFIKLGQVLSTRSDILAPAYRAEIAKMQDDVPPLPTQLIAEVIEEDLRASPDEIFSRFDETPLGSASIGQVHAARLTDGREVVVKVRKPGVEEVVRVDLEILASLVDEWSPHIPAFVEHDAKGLLSEFGDTLRAELDYGREAANEELFRPIFKSDRGFNIPDVLARYTRNRGLVEERMQGRRVSALRGDHLPAVLRALDLLIDAGTRPWFVLGARDEIEGILASGLAANGESSERARDIVNKLVAGGHVDYEHLLRR